MNDRRPFQYLVPSLLIFLTLVALAASTVFTFTVGAPPPTLTASPTHLAGTVVTPGPEPTPDYSDQAQITDGIVVFGVIVVSIILFGIAWGIRLTNRRSSPPSRKV